MQQIFVLKFKYNLKNPKFYVKIEAKSNRLNTLKAFIKVAKKPEKPWNLINSEIKPGF